MAAIPKPRWRACKRPVAEPGSVSADGDWEPWECGFSTRRQILVSVGEPGGRQSEQLLTTRVFLLALSELGGFRRWRTQLQPSRSEARGQLRRLAELAGRADTLDDLEATERLRLATWPNSTAQMALVARLRTHPRWSMGDTDILNWLMSSEVDWSIVGEAAKAASDCLRRGDYADLDLSAAVSELVTLYELYTGRPPTMNKLGHRPTPVCRLCRTFFAAVDSSVPVRSIDNKLDRTIKARRRASRRG